MERHRALPASLLLELGRQGKALHDCLSPDLVLKEGPRVHGQFAQAFVQYLKPLNQLQADGRVEAPVVRGPAQLLLTTCAFGLGSLKGLPVVTGTPK